MAITASHEDTYQSNNCVDSVSKNIKQPNIFTQASVSMVLQSVS